MEKRITKIKKTADTAKIIFLDDIKLAVENYQTAEHPFFVTQEDSTISNKDIFEKETDSGYISKLNYFFTETKLPRLLYFIYLYIGKDNVEFTLHDYSFFSLSELIRRYNIYKKEGQELFCDLALIYLGMGHVKVISYSINDGLIYARHDGGANGYERDDHWKFSLLLKPSEYPNFLYNLDHFLLSEIGDDDIKMIN